MIVRKAIARAWLALVAVIAASVFYIVYYYVMYNFVSDMILYRYYRIGIEGILGVVAFTFVTIWAWETVFSPDIWEAEDEH